MNSMRAWELRQCIEEKELLSCLKQKCMMMCHNYLPEEIHFKRSRMFIQLPCLALPFSLRVSLHGGPVTVITFEDKLESRLECHLRVVLVRGQRRFWKSLMMEQPAFTTTGRQVSWHHFIILICGLASMDLIWHILICDQASLDLTWPDII